MRTGLVRSTVSKVGQLGCLLCFLVVPSFAQSLGEIARQERARKQLQPQQQRYVYTNDDLKRLQILTPEDRQRMETARKNTNPRSPQMAEKPVIPGARSVPLSEMPLGDVARYYRMLKQLRQLPEMGELPGVTNTTPLAAPELAAPPSVSEPTPSIDRTKTVLPHDIAGQRPSGLVTENRIRVARGDTLWKLAKRYLGKGEHWHQLAALNPQLTHPDLLRVGQWIRVPNGPSSAIAKTVRVQKGDTLWGVAQTELGGGGAWSCIAQSNPQIQNPNLIYTGQVLVIPSGCPVMASVASNF